MSQTRLLVTRRLPSSVETAMREKFDTTLSTTDTPLSTSELREALREYDAICPTITDKLDAAFFETSNIRTRIIANFGAGLDHVDLNAARKAGITVTNTPDVLSDATAELAILLMLMAMRRAGEGERHLRTGEWTGWRPTQLVGQQLKGKTLGIVGFGRIGKALAQHARHGFDMNISYYSRRKVDDAPYATYYPTLEELAANVDILSLHIPGGADTKHMVNADILNIMKPTALIVNTARGNSIDEAALADALLTKKISAAGLDVYENEPSVHPKLLECENAVLLPHLGSATIETRTAMGMRALQNLEQFFNGIQPTDRVT